MSQIRWGILGAGKIANTFAKAALSLPDAQVLAVASRSIENARDFAGIYSIPKAYGSYLELVSDPEIDAVYVATPHSHHYEHMMLCMEHGKPVLCEKAFTPNKLLTSKAIAYAKENKLLLMEAFWTRFLPVIEQVRALVDSGEIGELQTIQTSFGQDLTRLGEQSRVFDPALAGGALLDVGVYSINSATMFFGNEPTLIQCTGTKSKAGADLKTALLIRYGEKVAVLDCSIDTWYENASVLCGSKGRIVLHDFWKCESATVKVMGKKPYEINIPHNVNGFEFEIQHFIDLLKAGKTESDRMSFADTMGIVTITDECRAQMGLKYPFE